MSGLEADTVRRVAELARLQLTADEVAKFTAQLGSVLGYIEKLNAVDTKTVEPMTHALDLPPALRPDEVTTSPGVEKMLGSAPETLHDQFKVPQVIGGGG